MNTNVPKSISNFFAFALVIVILALPFIFHKKNTAPVAPIDSLKITATSTTAQPVFNHPALIGKQAISLAVASSEPQQEQGLSGTANLACDQGMLFIFDSPKIPQFWMKDMNYPLDMIWIDANKMIVGVDENVPADSYPKTFAPKTPVMYVLEAQAGFYKASYLKVGDTLSY